MRYFAYSVNRTRAYSIWETGENTCVFTEEQSSFYEDMYNTEYRTLVGQFHAHDYNDIAGEIQIIEDGEIREANDLFILDPRFTVAETATLLQLSEQRIRQLIADKQLSAKKRASVWLLAGKDILEFSLKDRPAHRPSK